MNYGKTVKTAVVGAALSAMAAGGISSAYAKPKSEPLMACAPENVNVARSRVGGAVSSQAATVRNAVNATPEENVLVDVGIQVDAQGFGSVKSVMAAKSGSPAIDIKSAVSVNLDGIAFPPGEKCAGIIRVVVPGE